MVKKVLFLLFAVLCLVSCRTASVVDDSAELETIVPVVENVDMTSVSDVEVPQVPELSSPSEEEPIPQQEAEVAIAEPETQYNDSTDNVDESLDVVSQDIEDDTAASVPNDSTEDVVMENDDDNPVVEEEGSETSVEDVAPVVDVDGLDEILDDSKSNPTSASQMPVKVSSETIGIISSAAATPSNDGSFLDRLTAFVLKEKLFSFGVFTVFVGLVMLIVVLIRDIAKSSKPKDKTPKKSKDKPEPHHEELAMEDEDEFLRSLLNS